MKTLLRVLCLLVLAASGCASRPPVPPTTAPPEVPLASPSVWRSGVVEQSIREARERRFVRDLWRAGEEAR